MARIAAIASLVIVGVIVADLIANPNGVKAASSGVTGIETPALNALLGVPTK
jgi:hypothetical protein